MCVWTKKLALLDLCCERVRDGLKETGKGDPSKVTKMRARHRDGERIEKALNALWICS